MKRSKMISFQNRATIHFMSEVEAVTHVAVSREIVGQTKPLLHSELKKYNTPLIPGMKSEVQEQAVTGDETMEEKA